MQEREREKKGAHLYRTKSFASRRPGSKRRRRRPSEETRSDGVTLSTSINAARLVMAPATIVGGIKLDAKLPRKASPPGMLLD